MDSCICGSNKDFTRCCQPFLEGKAKARTVRQLVRSRYAAYALGAHAKYLKQTWHPSTVRNIGMADLDNSAYEWLSLQIVRHLQKGDMGQVEFKAVYKEAGGKEQTHHEISVFQRLKGVWYYYDGQQLSQS
tara:strand:+ start:1789 stop:2181 length:393 start_codon:yes stop_codon:yes gene_type:complete